MIKMKFEQMINKVHCADSMEFLKQMPDECVDCVVTSPPYWALRTYGVTGEMGLEPTFTEHVNKMCDVFDGVKRVLKKTGTCWVNYGDTYIGAGPGNKEGCEYKKGDGVFNRLMKRNELQNKNAKIIVNKYPDKKNPNSLWAREQVSKQTLPNKCMAMIPARFAIEMCNRGWILRSDIVWWKPNVMPSSVKDRFTTDYEHLFMFAKSQKYYFERQYEPSANKSEMDYRRVLRRKNAESYKVKQPYENNFPKSFNENGQRNKRCVWRIPTKPFKEAHFAVFPEELCITPIKAGCPKDGIVLDPFAGAGTALLVAQKLNRNYVGIELNPNYIKIAEERLKQKSLF